MHRAEEISKTPAVRKKKSVKERQLNPEVTNATTKGDIIFALQPLQLLPTGWRMHCCRVPDDHRLGPVQSSRVTRTETDIRGSAGGLTGCTISACLHQSCQCRLVIACCAVRHQPTSSVFMLNTRLDWAQPHKAVEKSQCSCERLSTSKVMPMHNFLVLPENSIFEAQ